MSQVAYAMSKVSYELPDRGVLANSKDIFAAIADLNWPTGWSPREHIVSPCFSALLIFDVGGYPNQADILEVQALLMEADINIRRTQVRSVSGYSLTAEISEVIL